MNTTTKTNVNVKEIHGEVTKGIARIEDRVQPETRIVEALEVMAEHRNWSESTLQGYVADVKKLQHFLVTNGIEPTLEGGEHISAVSHWIKQQDKNKDSKKTIHRRIAALSSIYAFYHNLNIVKTNPYKALRGSIPSGSQAESHSHVMDFDELKKVYVAVQEMKDLSIDIEIPIKMLLFTGLRNQALQSLKVGNIDWNKEGITYDSGIENSKHRVQFFPLPPAFLTCLKEFIDSNNLGAEDPLCYGIQGRPIEGKQLNRITDKLSFHVGWFQDEKITPHSFRHSIASLLDEKKLPIETITHFLGHSYSSGASKNTKLYIRRIIQRTLEIRNALIEIEDELETYLKQSRTATQQVVSASVPSSPTHTVGHMEGPTANVTTISKEIIINLWETRPAIAQQLLAAGNIHIV